MGRRAWPVLAAVGVLVAAAAMVGVGQSSAQPSPPPLGEQGELDQGFADAGQARTDLSGQFSEANGVAVQPDGKVVTVGTTGPTDDPGRAGDAAVLRYGTDGALDATFGRGGVVVVDLYGELDQATAVALQADGRVVVVGTTNGRTQSSDIMVLRFAADGTPDLTFGERGRLSVDIGTVDAGYAVAIQPADQKIVVGGTAGGSFALLRLDPDGVPDETFDGDGIVLTGPFGGQVNGIVVQPDGGIVGVGSAFGDVAIFRLGADGSADSGFGNYGFTYTDLGYTEDSATSVVLRPDGTFAVAGWGGAALAVLRYTGSGFLDGSFNGGYVLEYLSEGTQLAMGVAAVADDRVVVAGVAGGQAVLLAYETDGARAADFGDGGLLTAPFALATGVAVASGGRLAVAGAARTALGGDSVAALFTADGEPDADFGGVVTTDLRTPGDELTAMVLDEEGRIVVAGHAATGAGWDFAVGRYDATGVLDSGFGDGGRLTADLGGLDRAYGVAVGPEVITVAGQTAAGASTDFAAARYLTSDGRPDTYFGGGTVTTNLTDGEEGARAVAVLPDDDMLAAGFADSGFALVRYQANGTLDPGFGDGGVVRTTVFGAWSQATAMAVLPDGRIVLAGEVAEGEGGGSEQVSQLAAGDGRYQGDRDFAVVRYLADGTLDPDFGDGGMVATDLAGGNDEATAVAVLPDGATVVAGRVFPEPSDESEIGEPAGIGVVRLLPNGQRDEAFGSFGQVLVDIAEDRESVAALAVAADGSIVLGGLAADSAASDLAVLRIDPAGALDDSFGVDGVARTDFGLSGIDGPSNDEARALAVRPDGSVVASGVARAAGRTAFALAGYDTAGAPAQGFGAAGAVITDFTGDLDEARAVAVQPDGRVVVAGEARVGPAGDLAVVRYHADGTLDGTFGSGGIVLTDLGGPDGAYAVAADPDGGIVVAGRSGRDVVVLRYDDDGFVDADFGDGGLARFPFADGAAGIARALVLRADGIVVAGPVSYRGSGEQPPFDDVAVARLTAGGALDPSFNESGIVTTDLDGGVDAGYAVVVQPDARIVVAGVHDADAAVIRYRADGVLDDTFGSGGTVVTSFGGAAAVRGLALGPDGALVLTGSAAPPVPAGSAASARSASEMVETGRDLVLLRLDATGAPVGTVGDGGLVRTALGVDSRSGAVVLQPDGAVVVAATVGPEQDAALVRYRVDGVPDPRFGEDGVARSDGAADSALAVALQPDGQLVAAGSAVVGPADTDASVLRFVGGPAGPVGPPADLAIELVAGASTVRLDTPLRYLATVRNNGPAPADAVTVTDVLPAGVTLMATSASQGEPCTLAGAELTCRLGTIAAGGAAGLTVTVQPTQVGDMVNTASVAGDQHDPMPANDSASVTTTVLPLSAIRVNPGVVPLGRVVQVIGTGFVPGSTVMLGYPGWPAARTVVAGPDGAFATPFVVFAETTPGARTVEARADAEVLATTKLLIVTDSLTPPNFVGRN